MLRESRRLPTRIVTGDSASPAVPITPSPGEPDLMNGSWSDAAFAGRGGDAAPTDARSRIRPRRQGEHLRFGRFLECEQAREPGLARCQRSGLVEGEDIAGGEPFDGGASLDDDPLPRQSGDAARTAAGVARTKRTGTPPPARRPCGPRR